MQEIRDSSPPRRPAGSPSWPGSTGPASRTVSWSTRPPSTVRCPAVPAESPTLGFTHLQFEALLTAAQESPDQCEFALVAMLGLLGLRIFEAAGADIGEPG